MFRKSPFVVSFIFFSLIFFCVPCLTAQEGSSQIPVLKANALKDFNDGLYHDALVKYDALLERYPKDGIFHYYRGICLLNLNRDFEKAAESLEFAVTRPNIPNNAFYYLGLVYMKSYNFTPAKNNFERFIQLASRQEMRSLDPARQLQNAENAIMFTGEYNDYEVIAYSSFQFTDSASTNQVVSSGGKLVKKPAELITPGEKDDDLTNFFFLPKVIDKGDYVYMAGYNRNKKGGAGLFRVKYLNGKRWGAPEPLAELNSEYDQILPYFDPVGNDLYFASKGHNSMGGYDVFKSHFDETRNSWSEPANLGFPVNSPYNEFMFIPGTGLGDVLLITDRHREENILVIYRLRLKEPRIKLAGALPDELKRIAGMGEIKMVSQSFDLTKESDLIRPDISRKDAQEPKPSQPADEISEGFPKSLNPHLKQALTFQFMSDSLAGLAAKARLKTREIADPGERWETQKKIIEWEKNSRDYQTMADDHYRKLKETESARKPEKSAYPPAIAPDTIIGGITVYRYTDQSVQDLTDTSHESSEIIKEKSLLPAVLKTDTNTTPEEPVSIKMQVKGEPGEEIKEPDGNQTALNRFVILDKSPYSANNPFPVDVPLPRGPFYQIQLGVFSQKVSYDAFGGISPVTGETITGRGMTRFYAGKFNRYEDAVKALDIVKRRGYNDAFIASWYNGQKMPPDKVREFETKLNHK